MAHKFIRSISTTCNDSLISVTIISPGKSLLPTPYRASSRAGKKRLLTAPTVAEPKSVCTSEISNLATPWRSRIPLLAAATPPCRPTAFSNLAPNKP